MAGHARVASLGWERPAIDRLLQQDLGVGHGVGQAGERGGVLWPWAASGPAPVEQSRGVIHDGEEAAPGVVEERIGRGAEGTDAERGGIAVAGGSGHGLPGVTLGPDALEHGGDGRGPAGVDGLLVGREVPVGDGLGRAAGERRQDDAARGVRIAVSLFESLWREGAAQVVELAAGVLDEQQGGAVHHVGERGGIGDPFALRARPSSPLSHIQGTRSSCQTGGSRSGPSHSTGRGEAARCPGRRRR